MKMFNVHFEPLPIKNSQTYWETSIIPWDSETFGFGVGTLQLTSDLMLEDYPSRLTEALKIYSENKKIEIITTSIQSNERNLSYFLQKAGFTVIDQTFSIQYHPLNNADWEPTNELSLTMATPQDINTLLDIAGQVFQHGRYHFDPNIDNHLANQRYKDWLSRSMHPDNSQQVLTAKSNNEICGFSIIESNGDDGYMHLHGIEKSWQGKKLGKELILQSLNYLSKNGSKKVGTKISASNIKAVNLHSKLHGIFVDSHQLLHWHLSNHHE